MASRPVYFAPFATITMAAASALFPVAALAAPQVGAASSTSPAPAAAGASALEVAAKVQKVYDKIDTFEADFDQQYAMKAFNSKKTSKGHVTFVKPGKMRWDYAEPKDNLVVSDGVTLWSFTASEKQARKMLVKDSQMPTALSFLTGKGDIAKEFDLRMVDAGFKGGYALDGTPKVATNLYTHVLFYVDGDTYQVRRVLIVDGQGNQNRFDFAKPAVNASINPTKFQWSPPAGVSVTSN
ncbi:MAG: hypothetical protein NVSMB1_18380 [Polyangiales bacterium]